MDLVMFSTSQWLNKLNSGLEQELYEIYGDQPTVIQERSKAIIDIVKQFTIIHGDKKNLMIIRAPGRANLMGRHIDHQGGFINTVAIHREILLAASSRKDNLIKISNANPDQFPTYELDPKALLDVFSFIDWKSFVKSDQVQDLNAQNPGDWSLYILAIHYRLQLHYRKIGFKGLNCLISGNIPSGSGLSSSAALGQRHCLKKIIFKFQKNY